METCEIPREELLPPPVVHMQIGEEGCDLGCARDAATSMARKYGKEPQLLSWFDRKGQTHSLDGECCVEGEPSWIASAEARKANLTVDVDGGKYVFIFRQSGRLI